jgi:hypothetical protein
MLSKEQTRLIMLFGYETNGGRKSYLWQNPFYFIQPGGQAGKMLDEDYEEWKATKRKFTEEELLQGTWIKESDTGRTFVVKFHSDHTLTETDIEPNSDTWKGGWTLIGGVLRINVGPYELDVLANKNGNVHSGIEFNGDTPNAYFKVIHK